MADLTSKEQNEMGVVMNNLAAFPLYAKPRTTRKIAKAILLHGFIMAHGQMYDPYAKNCGCDVYIALQENPIPLWVGMNCCN